VIYFICVAVLGLVAAGMDWHEKEETSWCIFLFFGIAVLYPLFIALAAFEMLGIACKRIDKARRIP
jgi:hypothetical protein